MNNQLTRTNMIKQQLRTGDVLDDNILDLYNEILREDFVPPQYSHFAYSDMQIDLPHQQRMLTPLEEGRILQHLQLNGTETILEVGTGTGFFTTLLSRLAQKVISVDCFKDFTSSAQQNLAKYHIENVELITGDAYRGLIDHAPYHVIIYTGALEALEDTHRLQLLPGGKLFAIVGKEPVMQGQLHTLDHQGNWEYKVLFETNTPPLIDKLRVSEFVF